MGSNNSVAARQGGRSASRPRVCEFKCPVPTDRHACPPAPAWGGADFHEWSPLPLQGSRPDEWGVL